MLAPFVAALQYTSQARLVPFLGAMPLGSLLSLCARCNVFDGRLPRCACIVMVHQTRLGTTSSRITSSHAGSCAPHCPELQALEIDAFVQRIMPPLLEQNYQRNTGARRGSGSGSAPAAGARGWGGRGATGGPGEGERGSWEVEPAVLAAVERCYAFVEREQKA